MVSEPVEVLLADDAFVFPHSVFGRAKLSTVDGEEVPDVAAGDFEVGGEGRDSPRGAFGEGDDDLSPLGGVGDDGA